MADLSNDLSYDLSLARFDELMNLRPTFARHKSILASIDHAIANVFDSFNHAEILVYTRRITELATMLPQLEAWGASIHLPFSQVYSTAIDVTYAKHATKMKSLMKLRDQMVGLGISTGGIEAGIAGIFKSQCHASHTKTRSIYVASFTPKVESRVTKAPELLERDNTIAEPIETKSSFTTRPAYENTSIPATTKPESAGKRSAFKELALRAFPLQIPFPLSESAVFKRKKGSLNVWSRAGITQTEPWSIAIKTISITGLGLHAATPKDGFNLVFDVKTQSILIYYKGKSLAEFYSRCQLDPTSFRNAYRLTRGRETRFEMIGDNNQSAVCEIEFHSVADYDDFVKKIKRMAFPSLREDILNKCVA